MVSPYDGHSGWWLAEGEPCRHMTNILMLIIVHQYSICNVTNHKHAYQPTNMVKFGKIYLNFRRLLSANVESELKFGSLKL